MKRLIFLAIVAVVLTSFASLRSAEAVGPPETLVCHVPPGVLVPAPNAKLVKVHVKHGDCLIYKAIGNKPGDRCEEPTSDCPILASLSEGP